MSLNSLYYGNKYFNLVSLKRRMVRGSASMEIKMKWTAEMLPQREQKYDITQETN